MISSIKFKLYPSELDNSKDNIYIVNIDTGRDIKFIRRLCAKSITLTDDALKAKRLKHKDLKEYIRRAKETCSLLGYDAKFMVYTLEVIGEETDGCEHSSDR